MDGQRASRDTTDERDRGLVLRREARHVGALGTVEHRDHPRIAIATQEEDALPVRRDMHAFDREGAGRDPPAEQLGKHFGSVQQWPIGDSEGNLARIATI